VYIYFLWSHHYEFSVFIVLEHYVKFACEDWCAVCWTGRQGTETVVKVHGNHTSIGTLLPLAMRIWHQCSTKHYKVITVATVHVRQPCLFWCFCFAANLKFISTCHWHLTIKDHKLVSYLLSNGLSVRKISFRFVNNFLRYLLVCSRLISGVYAVPEFARRGFAMLGGWLPAFGRHWLDSTYLRWLLDSQLAVLGSMIEIREPVDGTRPWVA